MPTLSSQPSLKPKVTQWILWMGEDLNLDLPLPVLALAWQVKNIPILTRCHSPLTNLPYFSQCLSCSTGNPSFPPLLSYFQICHTRSEIHGRQHTSHTYALQECFREVWPNEAFGRYQSPFMNPSYVVFLCVSSAMDNYSSSTQLPSSFCCPVGCLGKGQIALPEKWPEHFRRALEIRCKGLFQRILTSADKSFCCHGRKHLCVFLLKHLRGVYLQRFNQLL